MAKPQKPRRGIQEAEPPAPTKTTGNLKKPAEGGELVPLNLKVPPEFKEALRVYAFEKRISMTSVVTVATQLYTEQNP